MKLFKMCFSVKIISLLLAFNLITVCAIGQSVYVGKTGPKGKILMKFTDPLELKKLIENPQDSIWIVDVRSEKAFKAGHIPLAKSFPAGEIMNRLDEIPEDKYLVLYCVVGGMAQIVLKKLKKSGYKRTMNWGGISRWEWERESGS